MDTIITSLIPNLGIAGFSMWILYRMFLSYQARAKEKDTDLLKLNEEVRHMLVKQLSDNTKALNDNTEALRLLRNCLPTKKLK